MLFADYHNYGPTPGHHSKNGAWLQASTWMLQESQKIMVRSDSRPLRRRASILEVSDSKHKNSAGMWPKLLDTGADMQMLKWMNVDDAIARTCHIFFSVGIEWFLVKQLWKGERCLGQPDIFVAEKRGRTWKLHALEKNLKKPETWDNPGGKGVFCKANAPKKVFYQTNELDKFQNGASFWQGFLPKKNPTRVE